MNIGQFIKYKRKMDGITIVQLAEKSGLSKSAISRLERGESTRFDAIKAVLAALGSSVDEANAAGVNWWTRKNDEADYIVANERMNLLIEYTRRLEADDLERLYNVYKALFKDFDNNEV